MVKDLEKLLRRLLPEGIDLNVTLGEDTTVMADVTQIDQVLINLGTNARDAMTRGGKLKIETGRVEIDAEFVRIHGLGAPGIYGVISASDTGTGMDEKVRQKIFEPFYTTKEEGKGTGLCLSIVYGIVKQHRGYIEAESEPGRGTMFKLYLPSGKTKAPRTKSRAIDWQKGTETILFADDNRDVRQTGAEILRIAGYSVIEASD